MKTLHFYTEGFVATNVRAMLYPLIAHRRTLEEQGIKWRLYTNIQDDMFDCDVLMVESNVHGKRWTTDTGGVLAEMEEYAKRTDRLCYLDSSDSTALLHPEVLPFVDRYFKGQVLIDRTLYANKHYGNRIFTDYIHKHFGIEDAHPSYSLPVTDPGYLNKIQVWWNSSMADWTWTGKYRLEAYARLPWPGLLKYPDRFANPGALRESDISCRMGIRYARDTVAWQRVVAQKKLSPWALADRVSYREYIREMRTSKMVVSPFGWGEINYKDYETFIAGAALVKPNMSYLETWPNLYDPGETYLAYGWDGEDLLTVIEEGLADPVRLQRIAQAGQDRYRQNIIGQEASENFAERVSQLLTL